MSSKRRLRRVCERKVSYGTFQQARAACRRQGKQVEAGAWLHAYKCDRCHRYHVGNVPHHQRQAIAAKAGRMTV